MTAIVGGGTPGLNLGSREVLGQQGVIGNAAQGRRGEGVYVNVATGALVIESTDDQLVLRGADLAVVRTYDALGRLRDVADARVHMNLDYDKVGNRTKIASSVNFQGTDGEVTAPANRYFAYDKANRQIKVDWATSTDIGTQGHTLSYDRNGNRTSDEFWGTKVVASATEPGGWVKTTGWTREVYAYDPLNRLQTVTKDGMVIDKRYYDGAGRVTQSGPGGDLPVKYSELLNEGLAPGQMNGKEIRTNSYDANGRLMHQTIRRSDYTGRVDISWNRAQPMWPDHVPDGYDEAGNVLGYVVKTEDGTFNQYKTELAKFDGYKSYRTSGVSTGLLQPGTITQLYDVNGDLTQVVDAAQSRNDRKFVNDSAGRALYVEQYGNVQRQLIVNGEVLGIYGVGVDPAKPPSVPGANPNFADIVDFDFGYSRITASYPNASPGAYQVRAGDTLQSIAQSAFGDGSLWYRIAEANGLIADRDLRVGQTLNIPNRAATISNNSTTFKPYDPSRIQGDMTPTMPMPQQEKGGCGGMGQLLMIVVAIVVTFYTAGTMTAQTLSANTALLGGTETLASMSFAETVSWGATLAANGSLSISTAMVAASAGSIAGQAVGLATGNVSKFSWKQVALSAISAGVTAGTAPELFGKGVAGVVGRAMLNSAMSQGISVAVGLQDKFDWRSVAASGMGAGVGAATGAGLEKSSLVSQGGWERQFAIRFASGLTAGVATAVARGGKVAVQQVATDAFGNALGQSIAEQASGESTRVMGAGSRSERSQPSLIDLEDASVVAGPVQDRPSPTARFTSAWSGILTATQTGAPEWATATQQQQSSELYQKSLGEMKEVLEYTAQNPKLREALLSRYDAWMQEGGWVKPPMVQNAMVAFGTLIGDPTTESAVALSMAMSGSHGIRTSPEAMGGLLGMLALRNEPDRIMGNLDRMAQSSVVYDGTTYNSFQFGAVKSNALDVASVLLPAVPGVAARGATLAGRIAMAAGAALVNGVNFLAQATLGTTVGRAAIMSVALRTAEVAGLPAPVPGIGIYSSLRRAAANEAAVEPTSPVTTYTTRAGVVRKSETDMRKLRDLWDDLGYGEILSKDNRDLIAQGRRPRVDDAWIKVFPEDAGLVGEKISPHHIAGLPVTVPWPKTRHIDAHMPGGFRYNPGGPGAAVPFYPARQSGVTQ